MVIFSNIGNQQYAGFFNWTNLSNDLMNDKKTMGEDDKHISIMVVAVWLTAI